MGLSPYLAILLMAISLALLVKNSVAQLIIILLFTLFIVAELVSVFYGNGFIDYQFYVNLDVGNLLSGLFIFKKQAAFVIFGVIGLYCFLVFVCKKLQRIVPKTGVLIALIISVIGVSGKNSIMSNLYEFYLIASAPAISFNQALTGLDIDPNNYLHHSALTATKGKNIIVISLESMEQGFLSSSFSGLMPNLTRLSQEMTFYPTMPMLLGSSWTVASLYTYMTGMPLLVGGLNTNPFVNAKEITLNNIGKILNLAGYQQRYVMGMPAFGGMGDVAELFGLEVISESTYPNRFIPAPFGLYDYDLFEMAKSEVEQLREGNAPFALYVSTVSTHAPTGFPDSRMIPLIPPYSDTFEFSIASLDYSLGKFIDYLVEKNILDDTVIYIFPDHYVMGMGTDVIDKLMQTTRQLYVITNALPGVLGRSVDETLYQIDLPRLILKGAGVNTNARFLTDYLTQRSAIPAFIETHRRQIAEVNRAAIIVK